jgi:hypothetical protein
VVVVVVVGLGLDSPVRKWGASAAASWVVASVVEVAGVTVERLGSGVVGVVVVVVADVVTGVLDSPCGRGAMGARVACRLTVGLWLPVVAAATKAKRASDTARTAHQWGRARIDRTWSVRSLVTFPATG